MTISKSIMVLLQRYSARKRNIEIAGHSMGGSLAYICAFDLHIAGYAVSNVFTFGSQKISDSALREEDNKRLGTKTWTCIAYTDPIPRSFSWKNGWMTLGQPVIFECNNDEKCRCNLKYNLKKLMESKNIRLEQVEMTMKSHIYIKLTKQQTLWRILNWSWADTDPKLKSYLYKTCEELEVKADESKLRILRNHRRRK